MNAVDRYLPFGLTLEQLLVALVALATFASVLAVWTTLLHRDPMAARARAVARRRTELRASQLRQPAPGRARLRPEANLAGLARRLQLARRSQTERIRERLLQAGHRSREALLVYLACKPIMPIGFGIAAVVMFYGLDFGGLQGPLKPAAVVAAAILGFYAPDLYLSNAAKKRQQALQKGLPDGLDLLVICAEAGLSLDTALTRVANEIGPSAPELAEELGLTAVELNFLPERRLALQNLGRRCNLPALRGVVNTLLQTEKYGTPLAQSLRVLSAEFREQRMLRAEEKAARLPATLTVPMIVFILPTLFIVLAGPAMLNVYDKLIRH
ncbi:MAG: type II secretion system F family protein [Geminicoccaceae bacterium]